MTRTGRIATPRGAYRVARLFGVDVFARPSLLVMGLLLAYIFAPRFADGGSRGYVLGAVLALALYASVLIHELAHFAAARGVGMGVLSITLHFMGGETAIDGETRRPTHEFFISVAGPVASFAVAGVAGLVGGTTSGDVSDVSTNLAYINLIVAIVNLLPGLPLDGGHAVRGLVWGATRDRDAATVVVAWLGRVIAAVVLALPFFLVSQGYRFDVVNVVVSALVAAFLWTGSTDALRNARLRTAVSRIHARALARRGELGDLTTPTLPADIHGEALLRALGEMPSRHYRLVEPDGSIYGVLDTSAVEDAYRKGVS